MIGRFAADQVASVSLRLRRSHAGEEVDQAIGGILEAHEIDGGGDPALTAQLHAAARAVRNQEPERFDSRWKRVVGQLPGWLLLDEDLLGVGAAWIDTPTWSDSRAFLASNSERLLTDHGDAALAELALVSQHDPSVVQRREILSAVRQYGIDETYRPLLIVDIVDAWLEIANLEESKRFLLDHHDDLITPEATQALARQGDDLHHSLAALARAGQIDRGYRVLQTPEDLPDALSAARRAADPGQLQAFAQLAAATAQTAAEQASAAAHLAIALVLAGNDEQATDLIRQVQRPDLDSAPLVHALSDAIIHHPQHAPALAAIIRVLTSN